MAPNVNTIALERLVPHYNIKIMTLVRPILHTLAIGCEDRGQCGARKSLG